MLMTYFFGHPMWCKLFKDHNFLLEPFPKYSVHFDVTSESGGFSSAPTCCDGGQEPQCWAWMFSNLILVTIKI